MRSGHLQPLQQGRQPNVRQLYMLIFASLRIIAALATERLPWQARLDGRRGMWKLINSDAIPVMATYLSERPGPWQGSCMSLHCCSTARLLKCGCDRVQKPWHCAESTTLSWAPGSLQCWQTRPPCRDTTMACGLVHLLMGTGVSCNCCPQPAPNRLTFTPMRPWRSPSSSFRMVWAWLALSCLMRAFLRSLQGCSSLRRLSSRGLLTGCDNFFAVHVQKVLFVQVDGLRQIVDGRCSLRLK